MNEFYGIDIHDNYIRHVLLIWKFQQNGLKLMKLISLSFLFSNNYTIKKNH